MLVPKETKKNSKHQEPAGKASDRLKCLLKKIRHICTQNKTMSPSISNIHKKEITENCNSLNWK